MHTCAYECASFTYVCTYVYTHICMHICITYVYAWACQVVIIIIDILQASAFMSWPKKTLHYLWRWLSHRLLHFICCGML